jgi:hypothetical protein
LDSITILINGSETNFELLGGLAEKGKFDHFDRPRQGAAGIAMEYCRSVLSEVALGVELTTYVITKISFYGTIRLDFPDNARTNYTNTPIIVLRHERVSEAHNTDKKE